jgi:hypothetical protein
MACLNNLNGIVNKGGDKEVMEDRGFEKIRDSEMPFSDP